MLLCKGIFEATGPEECTFCRGFKSLIPGNYHQLCPGWCAFGRLFWQQMTFCPMTSHILHENAVEITNLITDQTGRCFRQFLRPLHPLVYCRDCTHRSTRYWGTLFFNDYVCSLVRKKALWKNVGKESLLRGGLVHKVEGVGSMVIPRVPPDKKETKKFGLHR